MSTAGKVLTVLVLLFSIGWLVLFSAAAQLNQNYGEAIDRDKKAAVAKAEQAVKTSEEAWATRAATVREQEQASLETTLAQQRVSTAKGLLATTLESQGRIRNQLEAMESAVKTAQAARDTRTKEREETETLLAERRAEVETLTKENADRLARLQDLRTRFQSLLAENTQLVQTLGAMGPAATVPASTVRR